MTFLGKLNDAAYGFINNFLEVPARIFSDSATRRAWEAFRDIGNVMFVIAFLVIVYSQITGAGVSNYGIKRMLPRIIIAAILVNISFYVCAALVDISNIVGGGLYDLMKAINVGGNGEGANTGIENAWSGAVAGILGLTAIIALLAVIIFAPLSLLAFAITMLILVARQAFVILLIVVAPVAFVAYLLPNTESWFKRWWKALTALLMVYPIIALVFGASTLAARILMNVASTGNNDDNMLKIVALGVLALPLFAVPLILKGAMGAAGTLGTRLSGLQDRSNRFSSNKLKSSRFGEAKEAFERNRQVSKFRRRTGQGKIAKWGEDRGGAIGNAATWIGTRQKAFDSSSIGGKLGGTRGAAVATQGIHKQFDEDVAAFKTTMSGKSNEALIEIIRNQSLGSEQRAAAAGMIMSRDHRESHLQALHAVGQASTRAEVTGDQKELDTLSDIQKQMSHDMKDKPWALGDQAAGQLVNGVYGRSVNHEGKAQPKFGDIDAEIKDRVGKKLSAASIAKMNPDEMNHILDSALGNELNDVQLTKLKSSIEAARANPQMNDLIKSQEAVKHQQILDYIAQNHPNIGKTTAPESQTSGTPPSSNHPTDGSGDSTIISWK
jgi:hypothetical protein